jgi:hypothetical protein
LIEKSERCGPHTSVGEKEINRAFIVATGRASCNDLMQLIQNPITNRELQNSSNIDLTYLMLMT